MFLVFTLNCDALLDRNWKSQEGRVLLHLLWAFGTRPDETVDLLRLLQGLLEPFVHHAVQLRLHLAGPRDTRAHHFLAAHLPSYNFVYIFATYQ